MIIHRHLTELVKTRARKLPVITITGPRQSGKTTLAKLVFPKYKFVSLENTDTRAYAIKDPRGFLDEYGPRLIIDEAQYVPKIFSHIQHVVDESGKVGQYVLTGSQNFKLTSSISQSLAGRAAAFTLMPFSLNELRDAGKLKGNVWQNIHRGFYPRLFSRHLKPAEWLHDYRRDYVERDVRNIKNIGNLHSFQQFMKLCAARCGQIINLSNIGNEIGVSYQTIKSWTSVLEASYIIFILPAYHRNFRKRITKTPKLYFYDTGLLCSLLEFETVNELMRSPFRGSVFENFIVAEFFKNAYNRSENRSFYYWRDNTGNEIDLAFEKNNRIHLYEMKSSATMDDSLLRNLYLFEKFDVKLPVNRTLIYAGGETQKQKEIRVLPWNHEDVFKW